MLFKHVVFNPVSLTYNFSPLDIICSNMEIEGWKLVEVVPHHQYESVAVFAKPAPQIEEEEEEGGYL